VEFASWYKGYQPVLVAALTVVVGDGHAAADAADEALVRALERWDRVGSLASPEGWTYRVGVNLLRRRSRRRAMERMLLGRAAPPPPPPPEVRPDVWAAVADLSARQRESIALRYLLDLSEAEVAEAMGVAVGTASATLATARARLASLLDDDREIEVGP
jgi:DNA-directed RNA polymerase specialized sigma24 family protein